MISIMIWLFLASFSFFSGTYLLYIFYARHYAKKPWKLTIDKSFQPSVSILVPAHDEEDVIEKKLENIITVTYPKSKIETIVVDDASDDKTLAIVEDFVANHPELNIKVLKQNPRLGKSAALNKALSFSTNSIVIVSDADTYWPSNILIDALPYLADPKVGAITGRGINENTSQSWVTKAEDTYLNFACLIRTGESKIHSTIRFEGGFCAYKKGAFKEFDRETGSDDSGTALNVVQHNKRAILVPGATFSTSFPADLPGKLRIKARRANQLIGLWMSCLRLMINGRLNLPKRIVIPEIVLFIVDPLVLLVLIITSLTTLIIYPLSSFSLFVFIFVGGLLVFAGKVFLEVLFDNLILLYALTSFVFGRRYKVWQKTKI
jgi:cellulose synthase/poly-beta-1,6-N-acetylglucosamine synthase-like glycosyltransferase